MGSFERSTENGTAKITRVRFRGSGFKGSEVQGSEVQGSKVQGLQVNLER